MVKRKDFLLIFIGLFFLLLSFYPTYFEITKGRNLADTRREFILEHNFYWPDFNLYLSKIRQGNSGTLLPLEKYTSEPHKGSLIQSFYAVLGFSGKLFNLDPNYSYQLGRIILSPLLMAVIILLSIYYFKSTRWRIISVIIVCVSGSFPRFFSDANGTLQIGRFMEWWSNIDSVQRLTFLPHILAGQILSFFILFAVIIQKRVVSNPLMILLVVLGNITGLVFPPSLITLNTVIIFYILINYSGLFFNLIKSFIFISSQNSNPDKLILNKIPKHVIQKLIFLFLSTPSLLYFLITTKFMPWSSLVEFHRTHPMMIPFWDYILGTGPVFFLGLIGGVFAIFRRNRKLYPMVLWIVITLLFSLVFTHIKEQSPLRFTQTGLFIPLGILGAYFFESLFAFTNKIIFHNDLSKNINHQSLIISHLTSIILSFFLLLYILFNLYMMSISIKWQTTFMTQRIGASIPDVPYPPQTMYPLKTWMAGIRWLRDNTQSSDVVIGEVTAGNFIPAYSGNTVFFGQSNTVNYNEKELLVHKFFEGKMSVEEAKNFLKKGRVKYVFESFQEREKSSGKPISSFYPLLEETYRNPDVIVYMIKNTI